MNAVPLRLLVIEDAPDDAELLRLELRRAGYDVTMQRVETLAGMTSALEQRQWDLVVSDHSMPGMTSFNALEILHAHDLDLPFIIFSGGIGEEEAVAAMRAGAKDYVMKGNVARLVPAIARELKQAEARRQRRSAESAIRELEQMREFALESAHIGEWEIELASRAFRPSARFLRLFGHDRAPANWDYARTVAQVAPDDRARIDDAFRRALDRGAELDVEFRVLWPDGGNRWLWARARRFTPEDRPAVLAGIMVDITQRKETEAQLHQALKMEAIGQLTGGIAHDFNNLLTVILGNSGLLQEAITDDAELLELVDSIHSAGRSGAELTKRLLAFARQQPLQVREIDLGRYLRESGTLFRQPLGPGIALDFAIEDGLPAVRIDPSQLSTVVLNLVINARDAMPDGGTITIVAERVKSSLEEYGGAFVRFAVADTGTGMPPQVVARAIEPFFTTKEVGKGTGLGLSMVYGFVRQSGGQIAIDSVPGRGTTINICLPSVLVAKFDEPTAERLPLTAAARSTTVLVVDDDRAVRGFLVAVARGLGHRVIEAADGREALAALAVAPEIELLFSDVAMPNGMTGYELATAARQRRPGLKILLTSGFPAREVLQRAALDPDIRVLQKPYDPSELAANITLALGD
jgi:two-component system, cell cycle sensor histidine kinase and response regulator CckA